MQRRVFSLIIVGVVGESSMTEASMAAAVYAVRTTRLDGTLTGVLNAARGQS